MLEKEDKQMETRSLYSPVTHDDVRNSLTNLQIRENGFENNRSSSRGSPYTPVLPSDLAKATITPVQQLGKQTSPSPFEQAFSPSPKPTLNLFETKEHAKISPQEGTGKTQSTVKPSVFPNNQTGVQKQSQRDDNMKSGNTTSSAHNSNTSNVHRFSTQVAEATDKLAAYNNGSFVEDKGSKDGESAGAQMPSKTGTAHKKKRPQSKMCKIL